MDAAKIPTCTDYADCIKKGKPVYLRNNLSFTFSGFATVAQQRHCSAVFRLLCMTTIHLVFQRNKVSFPNILGLVLHKHMQLVLM